MATGKTLALTRWTFVGQIMPLLFNMLSRLVIDFLPRSMHLLCRFFLYLCYLEAKNIGSVIKYIIAAIWRKYTIRKHIPIKNCEMVYS